MKETRSMIARSSSSYGIQRTLWSFGADSISDSVGAYSPVHGAEARFDGLVIEEAGLTLAKGSPKGAMETEPMEASEFDLMVPWWNADTACGGYLEIFLQVETSIGWSRWYSLGQWSRSPASFSDGDDTGKVETDTLLLATKSRRFKVKAELSAGAGGAGAVIVKRMGVISRNRARARKPARPYFLQYAWQMPLTRSRGRGNGIRDRICSPTCAAWLSVTGLIFPHFRHPPFAMLRALKFRTGLQRRFPLAPRAVARLISFRTWNWRLSAIFRGHLLIASIKFADGQLAGAPISKTSGHLVLIVGLRRNEMGSFHVLVNDPAASSPAEVSRRYDLEEFEKAWTGIAYVIEGKR